MGRYSIALKRKTCTCNPNNPCAGKYGVCLDLKLVNTCQGKCPFCIETGGYAPKDVQDPGKLATRINAMPIKNLLILGGEPLMYKDIVKLVSLIRKDINVYITTNGFLLTPELAKKLSPHVKSMNISIHHATSVKHKELTGIQLKGETLYKAVRAFGLDKVRINCNLVKGYVDSKKEVDAMIDMVHRLGVTKIRFAELQKCPALYVDAAGLFPGVPADPFKNGCEITVPRKDGMEITVRLTCGIVNDQKEAVLNPVGRDGQTQVMYSNGQVANGWLPGAGMTGIQGSPQDLSDPFYGCHHRGTGCLPMPSVGCGTNLGSCGGSTSPSPGSCHGTGSCH